MLYEFITPSDPVTFAAPDDKVAFVCALLLGNGKAFCTREDGESVASCILFAPPGTLETRCQEILGMSLDEYLTAHREPLATAFESFAYGDFDSRRQYDAAIKAITEPDKLAEFKAEHEDRKRTSLSKWVKAAWSHAKALRAKITEAQ